jgi:hypothetical protein
MITRRSFIQITSGSCGAVALVGLGRAVQVGLLPRSSDPFEAWSDARLERGLRAIVAAGVLAANPHDSQPWKFRLGDNAIDVHLDLERALGPVDPFLRQMNIGIGCALENLIVGATAQGLSGSTALFPNPRDATLAARLVLTSGDARPSAHVDMISRRHTNRGPYDPARLPAQIENALRAQHRDASTSLAVFEASSVFGRAFSEAIVTSTRALIEDDVFMRATDGWFRWTPREVNAHRDGPALDCAGLSPVIRVAAQLGPRPSEQSFRSSWLASTRDVHLATAAAFGVISVRDPARPEQLVEAGRLWQRVHLEATHHGVAMQPLDQWLELIDRTRQRGLAAPFAPGVDFASPGYTPVMMFRAGMPLREALPSARRPLEDVLS